MIVGAWSMAVVLWQLYEYYLYLKELWAPRCVHSDVTIRKVQRWVKAGVRGPRKNTLWPLPKAWQRPARSAESSTHL